MLGNWLFANNVLNKYSLLVAFCQVQNQSLLFRANALRHLSGTQTAERFDDVARGGVAELLIPYPSLSSYEDSMQSKLKRSSSECDATENLITLANTCRESYLERGFAHIPNFVRFKVVEEMLKESLTIQSNVGSGINEPFYSTEAHNVYQEDRDARYPDSHPRNALQNSSKWIMDFSTLSPQSPLRDLYLSPHLKAFVSYVVRSSDYRHHHPTGQNVCNNELYLSGCSHNAAYYNIYNEGDGLGWHFDRSDFGVNLELQPAKTGGTFEICLRSRSPEDLWSFDKVSSILQQETMPTSDDTFQSYAQTIQGCDDNSARVGPGSLVIFAGSYNLHRVTPVQGDSTRINAIMTYEREPNQNLNAYSLKRFFGVVSDGGGTVGE